MRFVSWRVCQQVARAGGAAERHVQRLTLAPRGAIIGARRAHNMPRPPKDRAGDFSRELAAYSDLLRSGTPGPHAYVMLLGLPIVELPTLLHDIQRGLPFRSYDRLARNVGLPADRLLRLVDIARRTLVRRRTEGRFSPDESDRLLRAARVFGAALSLFEGDREAALAWLEEPQPAFGGAVPLELARTEIGAREVEDLAYRLEQGVFS
jgi:putative toxin-antitoxin system antitoxin component (TIGR02293 family)